MKTETPRERLLREANPFIKAASMDPVPVHIVGAGTDVDPDMLDLDARDEAVPLVPLFKLDGHLYSIPADPPAGFALKFLAALKEGLQEDRAAGQMLSDLLGEEIYAAMATSPKVRTSDFAKVMQIVKARVLGPIMEELGK